ncbi:hypothetical protein MKW94_008069 [Papaver nudicaule]|uniref:Uncharacterized protein n=1 Tax=Papaver nudicaule TaxID=74823 RepID=A0AA41VKI9_PAPNU|nr:hypothetical protein [Papaver nudicaule]
MNPVRTLGPAIASEHYKGLWVYMVGPFVGTLLGASFYNMIRVSNKPVHAISAASSFKIRRMSSAGEKHEIANEDPLQTF